MSFANPVKEAVSRQDPRHPDYGKPVFTSGGGGGSGGGSSAQSTIQQQSFGSDLLQQSFASAEARDKAEAAFKQEQARAALIGRQSREQIFSRTLGGQLSSQQAKAVQPTAKEEILGMSLARPTTLGKIQTRETFVESKFYEDLLRQRKQFESFSEAQLFERAGKPGSGIVGISTEKGSEFSFTYDIAGAQKRADVAFRSLPIPEKLSLGVGSLFVGGVRGAVIPTGEFLVDIPLAISPGKFNQETGRFERARIREVTRKYAPIRELYELPGGGITTGGAVVGTVGLGTLAGSSLLRGYSASRALGLSRFGAAKEVALGLAPTLFRPIGRGFFIPPKEPTRIVDVLETPLAGGRILQRSKTFGRYTTGEQFVVTRPSRVEGESLVGGLGYQRTPFIEQRGHRLLTGDIIDVYAISGKIPAEVIRARPVIPRRGFGEAVDTRRFVGQSKVFARFIERFGSIEGRRYRGRVRPILGGLFGSRVLRSSEIPLGDKALGIELGQLFGASKLSFARGKIGASFPERLFTVDVLGRYQKLSVRGIDGDVGFTNFGRGSPGLRTRRPSTTSLVQPIVQRPQSVTQSFSSGQGIISRTRQSVVASTSLRSEQKTSTVLVTRQFQRSLTRERAGSRYGGQVLVGTVELLGGKSGVVPSYSFRQFQPQITTQPQKQLLRQIQIQTPRSPSINPRSLVRPPTPFRPPTGFALPPTLFLASFRGRGSSLFGRFRPRYSPSLTAAAFQIRGRVPKRFRKGTVDPFSTRVIPLFGGRRKKRR